MCNDHRMKLFNRYFEECMMCVDRERALRWATKLCVRVIDAVCVDIIVFRVVFSRDAQCSTVQRTAINACSYFESDFKEKPLRNFPLFMSSPCCTYVANSRSVTCAESRHLIINIGAIDASKLYAQAHLLFMESSCVHSSYNAWTNFIRLRNEDVKLIREKRKKDPVFHIALVFFEPPGCEVPSSLISVSVALCLDRI